MRTAGVKLAMLAFVLALGCSSSENEPRGAAGASSLAGSGGSPANPNGGAGQPSAGTGGALSSGGTGHGGIASGGNAAAGTSEGGGGNAGKANGSAGAFAGGRGGGGGAAGANPSGGSGGTGACTKNLACKLSPPASTGDIYQDCVDRINQFLTQCACLPALARRNDGEACADQMAEYDAAQNTAHAGFTAKICTPSGSQNECPGYSSNTQVIGLCMQQMWDEGPPPTSTCTGTCYETHGHFINMTDASVTKVACGFHQTADGKVWAVQNFSR